MDTRIVEQVHSDRRLYLCVLLVLSGSITSIVLFGIIFTQKENLTKELEEFHKYHSSFLGTLGVLRNRIDSLTGIVHHARIDISASIRDCEGCSDSNVSCPCFPATFKQATNCNYVRKHDGGYNWQAYDSETATSKDLMVDGYNMYHCKNKDDFFDDLVLPADIGEICKADLLQSCPIPTCLGHHDDPYCACENSFEAPHGALSCDIAVDDIGNWYTRIDFGDGTKACSTTMDGISGCEIPPPSCLFIEQELLYGEIYTRDVKATNQTCYSVLCSANQIYDTCVLQNGQL